MELDQLHEGATQTQGLIGDASAHTPETPAQQRRATAARMGSLAAGRHAASDLEEHFPQVARCIPDAVAGSSISPIFCTTPTSTKSSLSLAIWGANNRPRSWQGLSCS